MKEITNPKRERGRSSRTLRIGAGLSLSGEVQGAAAVRDDEVLQAALAGVAAGVHRQGGVREGDTATVGQARVVTNIYCLVDAARVGEGKIGGLSGLQAVGQPGSAVQPRLKGDGVRGIVLDHGRDDIGLGVGGGDKAEAEGQGGGNDRLGEEALLQVEGGAAKHDSLSIPGGWCWLHPENCRRLKRPDKNSVFFGIVLAPSRFGCEVPNLGHPSFFHEKRCPG